MTHTPSFTDQIADVNSGEIAARILSVQQPWATLLASGRKTIETRTWRTDYRGLLFIASSKKPFLEPAGAIIAVGNLIESRPMTDADEEAACCECYPGAYSWDFRNTIIALRPIPTKGQLGIFGRFIPGKIMTDCSWVGQSVRESYFM